MPDKASTPGTAPPAQRETSQPVPAPPQAEPDPGYDRAGVPTFESVREKIESRYVTALGATELEAETSSGQAAEEQYEARARAAAEKLTQIRESMRADADGRET